jgi:hypothetical protein
LKEPQAPDKSLTTARFYALFCEFRGTHSLERAKDGEFIKMGEVEIM